MKALVVENLCKNFGGLEAICQVCLEVDVGEHRAIIGPNGAGKTTLFQMIGGFLPCTSGEIYLFGEKIKSIPAYRRVDMGIAQTFQLITLFKGLSVMENAFLAVKAMKRIKYTFHRSLSHYKEVTQQAEQLLKEWDLWDNKDTLVSSLSYGDQRLLDLALAMARNPSLLLLDEPTSGLPLANTHTLISRIKNLSRETTVLLIEHNMDVALNIADKVTVLHQGRRVAEGTPDEIKKERQVMNIYLGEEDGQ